ncbi:hypothetical protein IJG27_02005 [Candidatus Saccharibacteria bacterium]|nr:hypothetical protein [Candidatus Saccharibacteria bacterium]
MISFGYDPTPEQVQKAVRSLPPQRWPKVTTIIRVMKQASKEQQITVFRKVFDVFASRVHPEISEGEQEALWGLWSSYGNDSYGKGIQERYIMQRLNNEVMWLPEDLREKAVKTSGKYQYACRDFFAEKIRAWKEIPVGELEEWLKESKEEFRQMIIEL